MQNLYCQGVIQMEMVTENAPGRTKLVGPTLRGRRKTVGDGGLGWGAIPFKPRDPGAGERERVKVRRLRVLVRPLTLEPSELEGGGIGLGSRGDFRLASVPPLRDSVLTEPRLPMTVCVSSSVSSSSVLAPDAELVNTLEWVPRTVSLNATRNECLREVQGMTLHQHLLSTQMKKREEREMELSRNSLGRTRLVTRAPIVSRSVHGHGCSKRTRPTPPHPCADIALAHDYVRTRSSQLDVGG